MDFRQVQAADRGIDVDQQRVQVLLDALEIETGKVIHQLLNIGRLAGHLDIDLPELMQYRRRRMRLKIEPHEKNAGEEALGLQGRAQAIAKTALYGLWREDLHGFVAQPLPQKLLFQFEDHRQRIVLRILVEPDHDPLDGADG